MPSGRPTNHDPVIQIPRSFLRLFFIKHIADLGAQSGAVGLQIKTDGAAAEKDDDGDDGEEVRVGGSGHTVGIGHVEPPNGQRLLVFLEIIEGGLNIQAFLHAIVSDGIFHVVLEKLHGVD